MGSAPVRCFIIPPYMLRSLGAAADESVRRRAHETLVLTERLRGVRVGSVARRTALHEVRPTRLHRAVYDAHRRTALPGSLVRREGEPVSHDAAVNEAYDATGSVHDFYASVFGRNSIDDAGMPLVSSVHYGRAYDNAFWDGNQMVYGDGDGEIFGRFTACIDVIAHELTHGVIQSEGDLVYHGQPGALNESLADVFGTLVKQYRLKHDVREADWLVGAGIFADPGIGAGLRSLAAPGTAYDSELLGGRDPQPAHMRDFYEGADDDEGVHINSGIPNHAFYLFALELGGYAWERAGRIWYDAMTGGMRRTSSFSAFAKRTLAAAHARDAAAAGPLERAWHAVGVLP